MPQTWTFVLQHEDENQIEKTTWNMVKEKLNTFFIYIDCAWNLQNLIHFLMCIHDVTYLYKWEIDGATGMQNMKKGDCNYQSTLWVENRISVSYCYWETLLGKIPWCYSRSNKSISTIFWSIAPWFYQKTIRCKPSVLFMCIGY